MLSKIAIALILLVALCCAVPGPMTTLRAAPYNPNAKSVPLGSPETYERIVSKFHKHMDIQRSKRQPTTECGLFDVLFLPPVPSDDFQEATCFALREVLSAKLDSSSYSNHVLVTAKFEPLAQGNLGRAGPKSLCQRGGSGMYYPSSLLQLEGNPNSTCFFNGLPSIEMTFNSEANWYLGLDGKVPNSQFDFVTVVSHELTHGLGFLSAVSIASDGESSTYDLAPDLYFIDSTYDPPITLVSDNALHAWVVASKSFTYGDFDGTSNSYPDQQSYSPDPAEAGSSLSHFIEEINDFAPDTCKDLDFDTCNSLMRPALSNGLSIHRMGGNVMNALSDMGYQFFDCRTPTTKEDCLGSDDTENDPRCDWCNSDDFCTDITLVDDVYQQSCKNNDYEFAEKKRIEDAAASLDSVF